MKYSYTWSQSQVLYLEVRPTHKFLKDANCFLFSCRNVASTKYWSNNHDLKVIRVTWWSLVNDFIVINGDVITLILLFGHFNNWKLLVFLLTAAVFWPFNNKPRGTKEVEEKHKILHTRIIVIFWWMEILISS